MSREDISIAFQNSSYATSCRDQTIPGNHPGHRDLHLGRQHAPDPVNAGVLLPNLYYANGELGPGVTSASDMNNHLHRTLLARDVHNGRYVLHSLRGGRRHFDECRGAEWPRVSGLRRLDPPTPEALRRAPNRRALGAYNRGLGGGRSAAAERRPEGRAMVYRRPDHHPADLGLCHLYAPIPALPEWKGEAAEPVAVAAPPQPEVTQTVSFLGFASPAWDETRLPDIYHNTRRVSEAPPGGGVAAAQAAQRRRAEMAAARLEDIKLVQRLPK